MSRKLLLGSLALGASLWLGHALIGCVGDEGTPPPGGDASTDGTTPNDDTGTGPKANGVPCGTGNECQTGFCVDGVCCESKCDGVCEKCNQAPNVGSCTPVPDGQDPDNECPTTPRPDAGTPPPVDASAEAGDASSDAAQETGPVINEPDGGITYNDNTCAGKCNGQRACKYPGKETTCGTRFCNTTADQGRATCDSKGHCELSIENCTAYTCPIGADGGAPGTACGTSCTSPNDCLPTHYCDGNQQTCKQRLQNGVSCTTDLQCQSGYCVGGVCCNDACNVTGGTCTQAGKVGQCTCPACATGACKLWYPDKDNDGYGDRNAVAGTTVGVNAIPGCAANPDGGAPVPPAAGYVENNTDCYDVNDAKGPLVHPGQTSPQTTGYGPGNTNFDYNCDGQLTKQYPEDAQGTCGTCGFVNNGGLIVCSEINSCSASQATAHTQGYHRCGFGGGGIGFSCSGKDLVSYHQIRDCGTSGTLYSCGQCQTAGVPPAAQVYQSGVIQGCY